jgi:hypothetical protein
MQLVVLGTFLFLLLSAIGLNEWRYDVGVFGVSAIGLNEWRYAFLFWAPRAPLAPRSLEESFILCLSRNSYLEVVLVLS